MADLSKLSDADLEAISAGDMSKVSDAALAHLAGETSKPDNSAGQWAGVGARALAPYTLAAGMGAAAGAPLGGIGAFPGAALGAGALALTDLGSAAYNAVTAPFGGSRIPSGSEAIQDVAGRMGIGRRPQTGPQRIFGTTLEMAAGAGGATRAANELAGTVTSPVARNVLNNMGNAPVTQMVSGGGSGLAVSTAQEAGVTNPYALAALGLAGGVAPYALNAAGTGLIRGGANIVEPFTPGGPEAIKARAYLDAFGGDTYKVNEALNLLRQGNTVEQTAVKMGSSGLAALSYTARNATTQVKDLYLQRDAGTLQGQANRLGAAQTNLSGLEQRNAMLGETQQAGITQQQTALGAQVPAPRQLKVGRIASTVRERALANQKANVVTPAYNAAFEAGPETFSFAPVEAAAGRIRGNTATALDPKIAPFTSEALDLYKTEIPTHLGPLMTPAEPKPAMVTLREADKLIQAVNRDLASIGGAVDSTANATRANLMKLKSAAMSAIESGTSPEAKALYDKARDLHRTTVVEPFQEGWLANFEREGATGVPLQNLEKVSSAVLGSEDKAVRFVAALGDKPRAMNVLSKGIEGEYRAKVVKNGVVDPKAHDAFMAKNARSLQVLDDAGLKITEKLNNFGGMAKALAAEGKFTAAATETQAAKIADVQRQAKLAQAELEGVTPEEASARLDARLQSLPEIQGEINQIRQEMQDARFFDRLAKEGVKAGGGAGRIATESVGKTPHMLSHLSMLTNFVLSRLTGKLDTKLAAEIAAELMGADTAQKALGTAVEKGTRGRLFKPSAPVSLGQLGVTNVLAPGNQNAMRGQ